MSDRPASLDSQNGKQRASRLNYVCEIAEAMKEEKYLKAQIAYSKAAVTNKDDLATLITHGDIDDLKDDFAEQNREHLDAAVEVIRNTKPTDRAKLGSSLLAVAENGGALRHLPLANASEAHRKFAKVTQVTAQELSRKLWRRALWTKAGCLRASRCSGGEHHLKVLQGTGPRGLQDVLAGANCRCCGWSMNGRNAAKGMCLSFQVTELCFLLYSNYNLTLICL
ncbi:uncharacterized protein LOC142578117 isoform X2 [Dermacentor variabilis]|uniref:uncharacterized protein LOC142578117 isoform X2 n=1 Tax=Dermacentor variabilis TaxID=34621 RepID=UPI003F5BF531